MEPSRIVLRQESPAATGTQELLNLLASPFSSQINSYSLFGSLIWSLGLSVLLALGFCLLRPRTNAVYAPRAKHADSKHAPPPLDRGFFSWVGPIRSVPENELVEKIGLDAVVFLRFLRMLRNIFLILSVFGLGVILPINLSGPHIQPVGTSTGSSTGDSSSTSNDGSSKTQYGAVSLFMRFTPQYSAGPRFWAYTICAYLFDFIICGFLWLNYRTITKLRRAYFASHEYQSSLHSRTLLLTNIPSSSRTDDGIVRLVQQAKPSESTPRTAIARNTRDLPDLIEDHEDAVRKLEKYLAKYLHDPNKLPAHRPTCKPSKKDRARAGQHEIDAIDYYTARIRELEVEIKQVRETIDSRNAMPYGFASYTHIEDAHSTAYATRKGGPEGTSIRLTPKPHDIIWKNLPMSPAARRTKAFWNYLWMTVLTVIYIVPNVLTSVFLSDLGNLGAVFGGDVQKTLDGHWRVLGVLQGILAPLVQTLVYLVLPKIFRRMYSNAGDTSKTSRERHVTSRLFGFFVFNNLVVFSIFASLWRFVANIIGANNSNNSVWQAIKKFHIFEQLVTGLINTSPFWITYQLQRNLGATVDLIQAWPLIWGTLKRKFGNPTPRELIELSAPPPFEYADYYNQFLFTATIGFCFATLNPIILPITAFYIGLDAWLKKYMLQYILITRVESGGAFWRMLFNRILVATFLSNLIIALVVGAQGIGYASKAAAASANAAMLYAMVPLPFLLWGFKIYCRRTFDDKISYFTKDGTHDVEGETTSDVKKSRGNHRVTVRFGNPALYKKLMTPMVSAKAQHLLREVYGGRIDQEMDGARAGEGVFGYSDMYMSQMSHDKPGKTAHQDAPFEIVSESEMDFENYKKRWDFRDEFGGDGELYGRPDDLISRPDSAASMSTLMGPAAGRKGSGSASSSRDSSRTRYNAYDEGVSYPKGYHAASSSGLRHESPRRTALNEVSLPDTRMGSIDIAATGHPAFREPDSGSTRSGRGPLLRQASDMAQSPGIAATPGYYEPYRVESNQSYGTPGDDEMTSYDYFRRGRRG